MMNFFVEKQSPSKIFTTSSAFVLAVEMQADYELVFSTPRSLANSAQIDRSTRNCSPAHDCLSQSFNYADGFKIYDMLRENKMRSNTGFETSTLWMALLLLSMILFTAAGNILVCIAVSRERKLQNNTNLFLISLAIADCMVALFVMPTGLIVEVIGYYPFRPIYCTIWISLDVLCCSSSIHHMSTMALDRYLTIRFPLRYGRNKSKRITLAKIACVWFISACICSPLMILGVIDERNVYDSKERKCAPLNKNFKFYGSIFAFCIPLVIMLVAYISTIRTLKSVLDRKLDDSKNKNSEKIRMLQKRTFSNIFEDLVMNTTLNLNEASLNQKVVTAVQTNQQLNRPKLVDIHSEEEEAEQELASAVSAKIAQGYGTINQPQSLLNKQPNHLSNPCIRVEIEENNFALIESCEERCVSAQIKQSKDTLTLSRQELDDNSSKTPSISERIHKSWTQLSASELSFKIISKSFNDFNFFKKKKKDSEKKTKSTSRDNLTSSGDETNEEAFWGSNNEVDAFYANYNEYVNANLDRLKSLERSNLFIQEEMRDTHQSESVDEENMNCRIRSQSVFYSGESEKRKKRNNSENHIISAGASCSSKLMLTSKSSVKLSKTRDIGSFKLRKFKKRPSFKSSCKLLKKGISEKFRNSYTRIESLDSDTSETNKEQVQVKEEPVAKKVDDSDFATWDVTPMKTDLHFLNVTAQPLNVAEEADNIVYDAPCQLSSYNLDRRSFKSLISSSATMDQIDTKATKKRRKSRSPVKMLKCSSVKMAAGLRVSTSCSKLKTTRISNPISMRSNGTFFKTFNHTSSMSSSSNRMSLYNSNFTLSNVALNERKALKVLIIIFSVFVTLWSPFFLLNMASAVCEHCLFPLENYQSTIYSVLTWLGYSSSMANPIVYTMFNKSFRKAFIGILTCRKSFSSTYYTYPSRYRTMNSRANMNAQSNLRTGWMSKGERFDHVAQGSIRETNYLKTNREEEAMLKVNINVPGMKTYTSIIHERAEMFQN